jgi:hypothetical protein
MPIERERRDGGRGVARGQKRRRGRGAGRKEAPEGAGCVAAGELPLPWRKGTNSTVKGNNLCYLVRRNLLSL